MCYASQWINPFTDARQRLDTSSYDLTILGLKLPDANGLTQLIDLRSRSPEMPVLLLTSHDKLDAAIEAIHNGARDDLLKPIEPPWMLKRVQEVLAERQHDRQIHPGNPTWRGAPTMGHLPKEPPRPRKI